MNCCESGDGMNKVSKLDGVPAESGESSVNKTKTKKKCKRVCTCADNKTKHTKLKSKKKKKKQPKSTVIVINVLYDVDSTRCDGRTWKILDEFTNFALSLYNRTHYLKYNLMELLRATGNLSMVDLMFRAKPGSKVVKSEDPTHRYVVFVEIVPPADLERLLFNFMRKILIT